MVMVLDILCKSVVSACCKSYADVKAIVAKIHKNLPLSKRNDGIQCSDMRYLRHLDIPDSCLRTPRIKTNV